MSALQNASQIELQQLLELFPLANLKASWPGIDGPKEALCKAVAEQRNLKAISAFVVDNLGCCKQHVYFFTAGEGAQIPNTLPGSEAETYSAGSSAVFVAKRQYDVILTETMERKSIVFLWPFKVQILHGTVVVQFVILERDIRSHVTADHVIESRGIDEIDILQPIAEMGASPTDVHKGVKALWDDGFMDSHRLKYIDPESTNETVMKEARGIKEHNPTLYEKVKSLELVNAVFALSKKSEVNSVYGFSVEPGDGFLAIHRYSERKGDAEIVIAKILSRNQ